MKVVLHGTCSECYQDTELILTDKTKEIICPTCGHSVPPLDEEAMARLSKDQSKRSLMGIVAIAAFAVAALLFLIFVAKSAAAGGPPDPASRLPGSAVALLVFSILFFLSSLGVGFVAASRSYVCEF
jgi:hypothetical protein